MSHELAFSPESKETLGNDCKQECVLKSPMHLEGEEGEVRLLAWDKPNSWAVDRQTWGAGGCEGVESLESKSCLQVVNICQTK